MKNISVIFFLLLSAATVAEAKTSTSSSSTVTNISNNPANSMVNSNGSTTMETSTTHTTTTTTATVSDSDAKIVSGIYAKYAKDSVMTGTTLTVTSVDGVVTISGPVTTQSQADEAVKVAKSIEGVMDVRSSISVTTNPPTNIPLKTPNY